MYINYLKTSPLTGLHSNIQVFGSLCHEHPHVFRCLMLTNILEGLQLDFPVKEILYTHRKSEFHRIYLLQKKI